MRREREWKKKRGEVKMGAIKEEVGDKARICEHEKRTKGSKLGEGAIHMYGRELSA